jgi:predicted MFS family arabinose efflux permease
MGLKSMPQQKSASTNGSVSPVRFGVATAAAFGAVLVGLGLARFAFAPLQPALVSAGWFSAGGAALLAAANLGGYLIGALTGWRIARRIPAPMVIRISMLVVAFSFLVCANQSLPYIWFFLWRLASGVGGGIIMGLAGPTVLAYVPESRRSFIGQMILYGLTGGIIIAGALMPILVSANVRDAWLVLGLIALMTTALTWRMWPPAPPIPPLTVKVNEHARMYCFQYSLVAIGLVPQMIFLVDYIARDLGRGITTGRQFFLVYGLGAISGPLLYSFSAGRIGLRLTAKIAIATQFVSVVLLLSGTSTVILALASYGGGLGMPALIAISLLRSQQITDGNPIRHRSLWGTATAYVGVGQAIAAFGTAFLIDHFGVGGIAYPVLFVSSATALAVAFTIDFAIRK